MQFEFRTCVYANAAEMHKAIAEAYLREDEMRRVVGLCGLLDDKSDDECADDTIDQWLLDEPAWAMSRAFSRDSLITAYASLRRAS